MDKIETIELVLEDFGSMGVINRFKGLKSLTLINCGIATIEVRKMLYEIGAERSPEAGVFVAQRERDFDDSWA